MVSDLNLVILLLCLTVSLSSRAQTSGVDEQILRDLHAGRWEVRRNAFERLIAIPKGVDQEEVQSLLIGLRKTEDNEAAKADPDLFEDDDYLAYDEKLTPLIQEIALKTESKDAWFALVYMRYNGDSVYGTWLAAHRESLPFLVIQLRSPYPARRMNAVYVIASMLAMSKADTPFPASQYQSLKRRIRAFATHENSAVRQLAIEGLGLTMDAEDAVFLKTLASRCNDPYVKKLALETSLKIERAGPSHVSP